MVWLSVFCFEKTDIVQGGPLPFTNGVITTINGLINGELVL